MVLAKKILITAVYTKATTSTDLGAVMASKNLKMETSTMVSEKIISIVAMDCIIIKMDVITRAIGLTIKKMVKVKKLLNLVINTSART